MALPFSKKKSEAAALVLTPSWHPNFRNYERLPDIKVVRTAFFINGAAISIVLALGIYLAMQEWNLHVLTGQIAEQARFVKRDKPASDQAIALFKKLQAEEARFKEVDTFVKSKLLVSDLLVRLAQTLPGNIAIDDLDLRENGLDMRLTVRGSPDAATGYATAYLEQLRTDKAFARFDQAGPNGFSITNVQRNATTGRLDVQFFLTFKGAATGGKKP